jgi:hypothetical protein
VLCGHPGRPSPGLRAAPRATTTCAVRHYWGRGSQRQRHQQLRERCFSALLQILIVIRRIYFLISQVVDVERVVQILGNGPDALPKAVNVFVK